MANKNYLNFFSFLMVSLCFIQVTFAQESAVEWFNKGTKASDPDDKIRCYQKSIELDPNFVEAHYNLAYIYKNKNELEKALQLLNKALTLCGEETDKKLRLSIYYELGVCYKRVNNFPQSIEMFEKAKMLANDKKIRAHILYELGRVALLIEDFDKALAQFNEGLQISDKNKDLFQTAIEMTQKEKLLSSLYNKGMTLLQQKNYGQAIEALSKVKELDPNYKDTNLRLFEAQNQLQDRSDVASVDDLLNEGNSFFFNRNYKEALNKYKLVTEISPFNFKAYYNMGQCYEKLGDRELAIAAYQKALLVKSNFKDALSALTRLGGKPLDETVKDANLTHATGLFLEKKYDEAIVEYSNYLKKEPFNFQAQFNLAVCYEQKGEFNQALEHYKKALNINNASVEALQGLNRVEAKRKEKELTSLKQQIEADLEYQRFASADSRIKQYLTLMPNDKWALDKARIIDKALEIQQEAETPKELSELDTMTKLTQHEFITQRTTSPDTATEVYSKPIPTEEKSQVSVYLIAGLIIFSVGVVGFIVIKSAARKPASSIEIKDTSVHSYLSDCFSNKRTGMVIVKSNLDSTLSIKGEIRIKEGNIVDARCGKLTGITALHQLLETDIPERLIFREIPVPSAGNIHQATLPLLMQWKVGKE